MTAPTVTKLIQGFFTDRLFRQLQATPQTVSIYRGTIRLLLFAAQKTNNPSPHDRRLPQPFHSEKSVRISKHDLKVRPSYHHTRKSIEAHLTDMLVALAITRHVEDRTAHPSSASSAPPAATTPS